MSVDQEKDESKAIGGRARAGALSPEERKKIAQKAATARWNAGIPRATHGDADHPLRIGNIEISCYVLETGQRVISQRSLQGGIGMNESGGAQRLVRFLTTFCDKGVDTKDLITRIENPIIFKPPTGKTAHGYEAVTLADICNVILAARKAGILRPQQAHIADQCEILLRGFATVGIIALVDEATGYQYDRTRNELQRILEQYVSKELARWERTFEVDFYKNLYRLKGWDFNPQSTRRSHCVARLTVDLAYDRIHPDLLKELKQIKSEKGRPGQKLHQWLTTGPNGGHPRLKQHLEGVTALMKVAKNWNQFEYWIAKHYPKINETQWLPFPELEYSDEESTELADATTSSTVPPPPS